jgi:outer membrane protein assembly factor BamD (BamD/ComL family)
MWGGNIPSVLAGEFCHSIGITLSIVYLAVLHQAASGERRWPAVAILLAAIGLSHTFAFLAAAWYSLFFLWPRANQQEAASRVLTGILVAVLLIAFWALPLPGRLVFTTEWSMIWRIGGWKEVFPPPLWPAGVLGVTSVLVSLLRLKPFRRDRHGVMLFAFAGAFLLYLLVPAVGFPDIRFIPIAQLFLGFLAADFVHWLGSASRHGLAFAACIVGGGLLWGQEHLGYIPSWLRWNYSGYEHKTTWPTFKEINEHLRGDINSPRVVFEHSQAHNRFGSSRAFENLALFSGRSTLEGVFHQASLSSPYIFYLQSEASERGSGPFPQHTYTRLDPNKALPHLRLFNVDRIVVVSEAAKSAYEANQSYAKTFESGSYSVFSIDGGSTGYAIAAANQPVLYDGPNWKLAFYRWYKHADLLDLPLVPRELLTESQANTFELRTDTIRRIPRIPYDGACNVRSNLEQYRISIDTDCPGRPHIVKVSYFPRWRTDDGSPVFPVSPSFMLITPRDGHIELLYQHNALDWLAIGLTIVGLLTVAGSLASERISAVVLAPVNLVLRRLFHLPDRYFRGLSLGLLVAALGAAALTRAHLRTPEILYEEAQESYRGRNFEEAARRLQRWTATDRDTFKQATALYQLGISYTELGDYSAAIETHERLRFEFPNVDYGAGTLFHLARNHAAVQNLTAAREYAALLSAEFPDSTWVQRLSRENPELVTH